MTRRRVMWAVAAGLLRCFASLTLAQTENSVPLSAQSSAPSAPIRVESKLVIVPALVLDKKHLNKGLTDAEKRCEDSEYIDFLKLKPTEPFIPRFCEELAVRNLTASDFHLFADGKAQEIKGVTTGSNWILVRDTRGAHIEHSETPAAIWITRDMPPEGILIARDKSKSPSIPKPRMAYHSYSFLYNIAFTPDNSDQRGCHAISVKVDRPQSDVLSRSDYCAGQSPRDILIGTEFGKQMEHELALQATGDIPVRLQTGFSHRDNGKALVQISLEFPWDALKYRWDKHWFMQGTIGTLGAVYKADGSMLVRFSDFVCCSAYNTDFLQGTGGADREAFLHELPTDIGSLVSARLSAEASRALATGYETQIELVPGEYDLRIVLSDGEKFGRAEAQLNIENYDGKGLALSSVMLCKRFRDAHVAAVEASAANFAPQYVPMVSKGIQVTPAGDTDFKTDEPLIPYFEIYAPHAAGEPTTRIQVHLRIVDAKNGAIVKESPAVDAATYMQPGSTTIPIAREVPISTLPEGEYRLEVQATDFAGRSTAWRSANFTIKEKS